MRVGAALVGVRGEAVRVVAARARRDLPGRIVAEPEAEVGRRAGQVLAQPGQPRGSVERRTARGAIASGEPGAAAQIVVGERRQRLRRAVADRADLSGDQMLAGHLVGERPATVHRQSGPPPGRVIGRGHRTDRPRLAQLAPQRIVSERERMAGLARAG